MANHTGSAQEILGRIDWGDAFVQALLAAITAFIVGKALLRAEWNQSRRSEVYAAVARVVDARYGLTGRMVTFPYGALGTGPVSDAPKAASSKALVASSLVEMKRKLALFELELGAGKKAGEVRSALAALEACYDDMVTRRTANEFIDADAYRRDVYDLSHAIDARLTEHVQAVTGIEVNIPWMQNPPAEGTA